MATKTPSSDVKQPGHVVHTEPTPKWLRVVAGGQTVADSHNALIMFEAGHTPVYYFPIDDVRMEYFEASDHTTHSPYLGDARFWTLRVGDKVEANAMWNYPQQADDGPAIQDHVAFVWDAMDAWFEENEEVYVHARDPYKRVDILPSTRHVKVLLDGETIAETHNPTLLFETGLPVRYYIPKTVIRLDLLRPSDRVTRCPYKGAASYYSVQTGERLHQDLVWYYTYPTNESSGIKGLACFFNERAGIYVDGEPLVRPQTKWSK